LANKIGQKKLLINLKFSKNEHPIVAQIFGSNPINIKKAAALCARLGFDGVDINMGCPDKAIEKQNAGAAMMKNQKLAKEIIQAAKAGAPKLPISVKNRIGYNKNEIETWIPFLLEQNLAALSIHLRTRKEMSNAVAHWELLPQIVALRDKISPETLIIGNGDVLNLKDAKQKAEESGCDGVMIGRAIFGNPWLFNKNLSKELSAKETWERDGASTRNFLAKKYPYFLGDNSLRKKLKILTEHTKLFEKMLGKQRSFSLMKKHFKAYVNGFDGAKELRTKLMETENAKQVEKIIKDFL
jgi:tRNA-dihydrouridine synthase